MLGIKHSTLSQLERGKSQPSASTITAFAEKTDINMRWLIEGTGQMIDPRGKAEHVYTIDTNVLEPPDLEYYEGYVRIEIAGEIGAGNTRELSEQYPMGEAYVPEGAHQKGMFYFKVVGDSMFPVIQFKALVGVNVEDKKIVSGGIYAIWTNAEGASLKYIFSTPKSILIKAENPRYPDIEITNEELAENERLIIGRVRYLQQVY